MPKRIKTSTPSTSDGPGWVEFLKGDQRRYLVPCPHCRAGVFLAWLKGQSALKSDPRDAHIAWDETAKREGNTWDFDRVVASAHCVCPHCSGKIENHHKTEMVRNGKWEATAQAPASFRSYHLPSLYASSPTTTFGLLAQGWLRGLRSIEGVQGFVNGMLAEPWESQSEKEGRTEVILAGKLDPLASSTVRILSVDVQQGQPAFYWVVREWDRTTGNSRRVALGTCDTWLDIEAIQEKHQVESAKVVIDSGDQTSTVYAECCKRGELRKGSRGLMHLGWNPAKGGKRQDVWKKEDKKIRGKIHYYPFGMRPVAKMNEKFELMLFGFAGPVFRDVLDALRKGKDRSQGIRWEVVADPDRDDEYWRQMDSHRRQFKYHQSGLNKTWEWAPVSARPRDHYLDCEIQGLAFAFFCNLIAWSGLKQIKEGDVAQ